MNKQNHMSSCSCSISDIMKYQDGVLEISVPIKITATNPPANTPSMTVQAGTLQVNGLVSADTMAVNNSGDQALVVKGAATFGEDFNGKEVIKIYQTSSPLTANTCQKSNNTCTGLGYQCTTDNDCRLCYGLDFKEDNSIISEEQILVVANESECGRQFTKDS